MSTPTRRQFIAAGSLGAAALAAKGAEAPRPAGRPMTLGLPTYMFKHYTLDQTIAMAQRVAVQHLCIRSNLLALDSTEAEIRAAVAKVKAAGLVPYGGGVIYMKDKPSVSRAFDYARIAGFGIISINIRPDLLPLLERKVREFDIQAAIHNHRPSTRRSRASTSGSASATTRGTPSAREWTPSRPRAGPPTAPWTSI